MSRRTKPIIAINKETRERKQYEQVNECSHDLGVSNAAVLVAVARCTSVKGWRLYDTPQNIRLRIRELEEQIKLLEE